MLETGSTHEKLDNEMARWLKQVEASKMFGCRSIMDILEIVPVYGLHSDISALPVSQFPDLYILEATKYSIYVKSTKE